MQTATSAAVKGFRLSPRQKRLWVLGAAADPRFGAWCRIEVRGALRDGLLRRALDALVSRHEVLRTTLHKPAAMDVPLQMVGMPEAPEIVTRDLRGLSPAERDAERKRLAHEWENRPTDILLGRCLRVLHLVLDTELHLLCLRFSAFCADRATLNPFLNQLALACEILCAGGSLPEPELQYADLAEWQNSLLEDPERESGRSYWRERFPNGIGRTGLPFQTRARGEAFSPRAMSFDLDPAIQTALADRAGGPEATAFPLACWLTAWARTNGEKSLVVGVGVDGRHMEELADAVGPLSRYVPVRVDLSPETRFGDLVSWLKKELDEAENWSDYFAWDLLSGDPGRDGPPCFSLVFEHAPWPDPVSAGGLKFSVESCAARYDRFGMALIRETHGDRVELRLEWDGGLYRERDVSAFTESLSALILAFGKDPNLPLGAPSLLNDDTRKRLINEFHPSASECPARLVHHALARHAERDGGLPALRYGDHCLSYAELWRLAGGLAKRLAVLGVGPEHRVAVFADRSAAMMAGLWAVLCAGAAYVPLEPGLPPARLAHILGDAGVTAVLSLSRLKDRLSGLAKPVLFLDTLAEGNAGQASPAEPLAGNLAYLIYTSGTSGQPKGVAVAHRQLSGYVDGLMRLLEPPRAAGYALVSTPAADLGNTAIFTAAETGGCLTVVGQERAADPEALATIFREAPVDYLKMVPSHLAALLPFGRGRELLPRRALILGGESCPLALLAEIRRRDPNLAVFNHYGPTEATVGVLAGLFPAALPDGQARSLPLGRPLAHARAYVLDRSLRQQPCWVSGELALAGPQLARGYFRRPELTAAGFVPDPLADAPGGRLYRTGDLARFVPGPDLEFLGRADHQVKIHGYRVELAEIETALASLPQVARCAVTVREDRPGDRRLCAYLVAAPGERPDLSLIRGALADRLPEFMLPQALVVLPTLPLTANGKLDRSALPAPDPQKARAPYAAPRNDRERRLTAIWQRVLCAERVGVHDNFFELGGDSILGIQIVAEANRQGLRLTPMQIFESQTVAELAAAAVVEPVPKSDREPADGPAPLTPIQHWFFELNPADRHHWNQSVLLSLPGSTPIAVLHRTVARIVAHHDAFRLRFERKDGFWRQTHAPMDEPLPCHVIDLAGLGRDFESEALTAVAEKVQRSLDLARGPLTRIAYFLLAEDRPLRLLWATHHLIVDAFSWRILLEDLHRCLKAEASGETMEPLPKTASFQRWSEELTALARTPETTGELAFWRDFIGAAPAVPVVDFPAGENLSGTVAHHSLLLEPEETESLRREAHEAFGARFHEALLAGLVPALARWIGTDAVLLEMEGHGREPVVDRTDLSRSVGWFTSRFPVCLRVPNPADPGTVLTEVKERMRRIPNRGIGFGLLRYLADREIREACASLPRPWISFNYLGKLDQTQGEGQGPRMELGDRGTERGERGARPHILDINAYVAGGRLKMIWSFSRELHREETITALAADWRDRLRALTEDCRARSQRRYTPADFPLANLSTGQLDNLMARIRKAKPS